MRHFGDIVISIIRMTLKFCHWNSLLVKVLVTRCYSLADLCRLLSWRVHEICCYCEHMSPEVRGVNDIHTPFNDIHGKGYTKFRFLVIWLASLLNTASWLGSRPVSVIDCGQGNCTHTLLYVSVRHAPTVLSCTGCSGQFYGSLSYRHAVAILELMAISPFCVVDQFVVAHPFTVCLSPNFFSITLF